MSYLEHAKRELDLLGMTEDSSEEINRMMRNNILQIIETFGKQGHSGFSASYAINILEKIMRFEPVLPLTGADDEWVEIAKGQYQNKRCSHVFKNEYGAYDIEGIIFYDWYEDPITGEKYKSHFTCRESHTPVTFPYTPKKEYHERV